jgi:hypothetical protein
MAKRPKRANLKPPGHCIFCGSGDLSKEHVWSDWLNQVLLYPKVSYRIFDEEIQEPLPFSKPRRSQRVEALRQQGTLTSLKVKVVCKSCNNGWMGKIVERAKPTVLRLLSGEAAVIYPTQQRELAAWIALCCITAEYIPGNDQVVPAAQRRYIFRHHRPPEEWSIFIGHFSGGRFDPFYKHQSYFLRGTTELLAGSIRLPIEFEDSGPPNTVENIFVLEHLLVHAFMTTSSPRNSIAFEKWADPRVLIRVWPPQRIWPFPAKKIKWPPATTITDNTIEYLIDGFYKHIVDQPKPP